MNQRHGPAHVDFQDFPPPLQVVRVVLEGGRPQRAGVVEQNVDWAERAFDLPDKGRGCVAVAHVAGDGDGLGVALGRDFRDHGVYIRLGACDAGYRGARRGECESRGFTDATAGAGQKDYFSRQRIGVFRWGDIGICIFIMLYRELWGCSRTHCVSLNCEILSMIEVKIFD